MFKKILFGILVPCLFVASYFSFSSNPLDFADAVGTDDVRQQYEDAKKKRLVNVGLAPFAIAHPKFNCGQFLDSLDDVNWVHIAWLFHTFGKDYDCLKTLLADPRLITLETNLINEPGHRNRRLEKHEFLYGISSPQKYDKLLKSKNQKLKNKFFDYVFPLQVLLAKNLRSSTQCLINPGLESNVSDRAGKVLVAWTREAFPDCKVVWNPLNAAKGRRAKAAADFIEGHGAGPKVDRPCLTNLDGTDVNFPERQSNSAKYYQEGTPKNWINSGNALQQHLETYANKCEVSFIWVVEYNCIDPNGSPGSFTPPTKRQCVTGKIHKLVKKELNTAHKKGAVYPKQFIYDPIDESSFQGCKDIRKPFDGAKVGFLLKQSEFSDRGGVIILRTNSSSVKVVHRGKTVDTYRRDGIYHGDGRALFRSNKSPLKYPFKVAIKFTDGICYRVDNPRIRND